jgi:hypothetical protein
VLLRRLRYDGGTCGAPVLQYTAVVVVMVIHASNSFKRSFPLPQHQKLVVHPLAQSLSSPFSPPAVDRARKGLL